MRGALKAGQKHPWRPRSQDKALNDLNSEYFFSTEGKTSFIFHEELNANTGRRTLRPLYPQTFKDKFANQFVLRVVAGGGVKPVELGKAWFTWPGRRQYDRVTFVPGRELPISVYNEWQGFGAEAVEGDCSSFLEFIRDVVCNGDEASFNYVICWLARAVQEPWKQGEVAIVLQGGKGVGKSFFASHIGELFGAHYVELTQSRHLVSHFNAHLATAVIVFADEAYWAGDKQGEGTLKALITSAYHLIERKGIDAKMAPNYTHLIMASNADWVVPASIDERRFCVLKVPAIRQNDHDYFSKLEDDWQNGGREAFLYHLLHLDLTGFNVRRVPQTEALLEQKLHSLADVDRWLLDALRNGEFVPGDGWPEWLSTKDLFMRFKDFCSIEGVRTSARREAFGMRLGNLLPPRADGRPTRIQRQQDKGKRNWGYEFAPLTACRDRFCEVIGFALEWETAGEVADVPDLSGGMF